MNSCNKHTQKKKRNAGANAVFYGGVHIQLPVFGDEETESA